MTYPRPPGAAHEHLAWHHLVQNQIKVLCLVLDNSGTKYCPFVSLFLEKDSFCQEIPVNSKPTCS